MSSRKSNNGITDYNRSDIPYSIMFSGSHIEFFGNTRMIVEGKYLILEYSSQVVKVKLSKKILMISGDSLLLGNVDVESFVLTGNILSINFE